MNTAIKIKLLWLAILLLLQGTAAEAMESGQYVVNGIGGDSCASFVLSLSDYQPTNAIVSGGKTYYTMANAYTQWLAGYITAGSQGANRVDVNGMVLWIKKYCEDNPSESIVFGAGAFIRAHHLLPSSDTKR
ncbi:MULTISPECIES: hypothetical protein [Pseudomonas]|uniref:Rap1a immunity protein domain-containing protein n=1 Tax=Pseudomonas quercus TaxID=2722792 RepID=A0ABX0YGH2_9PSED|nr:MULTISPECIES: hypothetical protein [Pseudomonas]MBF7144987.1 hypothetical protein [Pseudomonas sp. LY10J]NJP01286.1 hypothetical protein [Pseudomonas quercus]